MTNDSTSKSLEEANAFFARADARTDGLAALRAQFPHAPPSMLETAAFHVYVDGCEAALEFIAAAERMIRDPIHQTGPDFGVTTHLLYHVYNWHQFQALLPDAKPTLVDLAREIKKAVVEDDRPGIVKIAEVLESWLEGHLRTPDFD